MPLIALDSKGNWVSADTGDRHLTYSCPECHAPLRLRRGLSRKTHFFHLHTHRRCRHHGKSRTHAIIQEKICASLPSGETSSEYPFPTISRIADVAWHSQKLIFEVQCSPLSPQEMEARNRDYQQVGYQVVWILHEKTFAHPRIEEFSSALNATPHYFTNMNSLGIGAIYDQMWTVSQRRWFPTSKRFYIDLNQPVKIDASPFRKWPLHFSGDIAWHSLHNPSFTLPQPIKKKTSLWKLIAQPPF